MGKNNNRTKKSNGIISINAVPPTIEQAPICFGGEVGGAGHMNNGGSNETELKPMTEPTALVNDDGPTPQQEVENVREEPQAYPFVKLSFSNGEFHFDSSAIGNTAEEASALLNYAVRQYKENFEQELKRR